MQKLIALLLNQALILTSMHSFITMLCIIFIRTKTLKGISRQCNSCSKRWEQTAQPSDFGKAAQNLYNAAAKSLKNEDHQQAIQWVTKALQGDDAVMDRVNYIVMIGDSYRALKN